MEIPPFLQRLERGVAVAVYPLLLLGLSAGASVLYPRRGGSLMRIGTSGGLLVLTWQLVLLLALYLAAALLDALPPRRRPWRCPPVTWLVTLSLLILELGSWFLVLTTGSGVKRAHLRFLFQEAARLPYVTTRAELAALVLFPVVSAIAAVLLLRPWRRDLRLPRGRARVLGFVTIGLLASLGVGHLPRLNDASALFDVPASMWTTVGRLYRWQLGAGSLPLVSLLFDSRATHALEAVRPEVRPFIRTGPPIEPAAAWIARARTALEADTAPPLNVLLVKVDSLRWDELEATGGDPRTMPFLSRLATQGLFFDRCYAPSSETSYSFPALLVSQYPLRRAIRDWHRDVSYPHAGLEHLLRPLGYRAGLFTMGDFSWQHADRLVRRSGFDDFVEVKDIPEVLGKMPPRWLQALDQRGAVGRRVLEDRDQRLADGIAAEALVAWVADRPEQPFYAVLDILGPHHPYRWPASLVVPFTPWQEQPIASFLDYPSSDDAIRRNAYRNALHAGDRVLEATWTALERSGHAAHTLLVVTADHGQSFHEHGLAGHGRQLFEQQVRIPLLFYGPGLGAEQRSEAVSLIDVLPTILGRLGLPAPAAFQGFDLLDAATPRSRPIYMVMQSPLTNQEAVYFEGYKYIDDFERGETALYSVLSDPEELHNLVNSAADAPTVTRLQSDLRAWHMSQLIYYANNDLFLRFFPPRYERLWAPPPPATLPR